MTQIKKKTHNITTTGKKAEFGFTASQINVKASEKLETNVRQARSIVRCPFSNKGVKFLKKL